MAVLRAFAPPRPALAPPRPPGSPTGNWIPTVVGFPEIVPPTVAGVQPARLGRRPELTYSRRVR